MVSKPLKELCIEGEIGKYGIPASAEDFSIKKTRYLRISDIDDFGNLMDNDKKSVSSKDIDKYILKEGDLVFARTGNSTGRAYYHELKNGTLAFAGFLIKYGLDSKKVNPKYLKYFTVSKQYKNWVANLSVGSTRGNINAQTFADCPILLPSQEQQNLLVKILSSLDVKIELNGKINKELEAMAKTLYDYWFVQFDFPDEDGKPYKSSGGKMVCNQELKREIPQGWEVKKLDDVIVKTGTGLNPRDNFKLGFGNNYYVTIKNIEQGKVILDDKCDKVDDEALKIINKRSDLKVGDILFTSIQPVGVTYLIQEQPKNWNINESVFTVRPDYNLVSSDFLFMLLSSDFMKAYTNNVSAGSIHKGVRHTDLKTFKFAYSGNEIIKLFDKKIKPILKKMYVNEQQNQELAKLRDWLLPMLMNGQVSIK
ncbi:MAG: restriction endonuclease subunit S [Sulfurimonas sp.]|uniref:restriction endonuclease subunit S n=1 Tax=Sulfurimonas sp. TaxID=2022749 RepID=UPI00263932E3|nr:restriction endonuclease subunit S [Sulfurimonas sp.]MDD5399559.1 restriction endonuclease subunit S [Sulfurimonas sp.]